MRGKSNLVRYFAERGLTAQAYKAALAGSSVTDAVRGDLVQISIIGLPAAASPASPAAPNPNADAFLLQLKHLFGQLPANCDGLFEVAWTPPGSGNVVLAQQFDLNDLETAVEHMTARSAEGRNVYVAAGIRSPDTPRSERAKKEHLTRLTALWADFDDEEAAEAALHTSRSLGVPQTLVVQSASTPHHRVQFWWRLEGPTADLDRASDLLATLAAALGGDPTVRNVDRVMRAAGLIAHAVKPGRVTEPTRILDTWSERRPPYIVAEIARALEGRTSVAPAARGRIAEVFDFNAARPRTTQVECFAATLQPGSWRAATRDHIARMVREGSSDDTIASLAWTFKRDGCSVEQTER